MGWNRGDELFGGRRRSLFLILGIFRIKGSTDEQTDTGCIIYLPLGVWLLSGIVPFGDSEFSAILFKDVW